MLDTRYFLEKLRTCSFLVGERARYIYILIGGSHLSVKLDRVFTDLVRFAVLTLLAHVQQTDIGTVGPERGRKRD